ncbi:hypothetical protein [Streptomyces endophyticus]|uniref:DUF4131 domain-containing protein n=1 Tax=Streptomyces endophyticus TaxID=714166 RepID=A0ABU6FIQ0_9ACTN|nr:hypothetical protein [Streptomyces endophyticus]MEB8343472.1 DUF4131 domain-containing protein [Streptomyces endophyticus]
MNDASSDDRLLMLAVTGEPLPDDDPDAAAVAADVALLRDQVRGLGDALASRPEREPEPVRVPVRRRRPLRLAFGGLVVACVASLFGGLVWLGVSAPGGGEDSGASDKSAAQDGGKSASSHAMRIACSRILVEGRVTRVTPRADGDVRVVLDVKRYYRPERSARTHPTMAVTLDGAAEHDLRPGTYTLIRVPLRPADRQDWKTGRDVAEARADILRWLPQARSVTCPGPS